MSELPITTTLWGGRFAEAASPLLRQFNDSIPFDKRLWLEDIFGSMAYANAIAAAGLQDLSYIAVGTDIRGRLAAGATAGTVI